MKFSKDFLKMMDGAQPIRLSPLPLGRLRTSDTFISRNSIMTASTVDSGEGKTFVLPKIKSGDDDVRPLSVIGSNDEDLVLSPLPACDNENEKVRFRNAELCIAGLYSVDRISPCLAF